MAHSPKGFISKEFISIERRMPDDHAGNAKQVISLTWPTLPQEIKNYLEFWRTIARSYVKKPTKKGGLDHVAVARQMLKELAIVDSYLARRNQSGMIDQAAIYHMLLFASYVHQLNESAIVGEIDRLKGSIEGGKERARQTKTRNNKMAEEFLRRRGLGGGSKISKTALMRIIGTENGLSRSAAVDAINKGLKILSSATK